IASGMSVSSVKATRASGIAIGYLKYQFSMREMEEQIQKEQTVLEASLKDIETANQKAAEKLNDLAIEKSLFLTGILFLVGVGIVFGVTMISRHFSLRVTKPIEQLTNVAAEMVRGKYEQSITIESDDEIGLFADTFQELSSAIVQRDSELASINKDLEQKVEERTEQLSKELNTTANLLNNMKQAVFSVDSNGLIIPPVSRSAYTIFGGAIEGQSVMEVVYRDLGRESSQMDPLKSALVTIFGEDELQWDLMESNLPRRVIRHGSIDKEDIQKLRISYSPLWNREMKLEHLMFVVEDVSHVEKLESEIVELRQQSEERAQIIQEVSDADPGSVKGFMSSAAFALAGDLTKRPITLPRLTAIRKNLHTIKGNARACGFSLNAKMVHSFEDRCQAIAERARHSGILLESEAQEIDDIIKRLHEQISEYSAVAAQIFKIKTDFKGQSSEWLSLNQNLRSFERMILDSAKSSGKSVQFLVVGEEISLETTQVQVLRDSFIHLLNNCLAHGIESPEERVKRGKNSVGNITVDIRRERQNIVMVLTDDGGGIDLNKLGRIVVEKGLKSEQEIATMGRQEKLELVFLPNVSSLEGVSQIAGRGLGLDVVRENIQMLGGSIKVMSEIGSGTAFEIVIPSVLPGREALSA
ncbi:MAG TPA: ATP-binding protein, partial [Pseudobdellovibrionaceae bacterium]|nr:ATP-binding protein [Pseudobdellovibrionaceae bacterium]